MFTIQSSIYRSLISILFGLGSSGVLFAVTNSLTITEKGGVTTANYPIQIGRPFIQGEIANSPQAIVDGMPVTTQADVKQRWPDGSVKHAIVAFLVPKLNSGSTVTVTFRNQSSGNNSPLSAAQMLDASYDFNAQTLLTNGTTIRADARTMLNTGNYTNWTSGTVAQTVILADHSAVRAYDIGFDSNRSFRPIFHATFWPGIKKVRVRFIGEIANTEALQNMTYSLALKIGNASPQQMYAKASFSQGFATRWTKEFWIGGAPAPVAINHNLGYVKETRFAFNYDTNKTIPTSVISGACTAWNGVAKDLGDAGGWTKYQPQAGGRPDIGPYPEWTVRWLYTGDKCAQDEAFGNADLSAAWPVHIREGKTDKPFLRGELGSTGLGKILSLTARPTTKFGDFSYSGNSAGDKITPVGTIDNLGWIYDPAHEPDVSSIIYALTGDFWYLEEMWFWASAGAAANYPGIWERGPSGEYGVPMQVQIRAAAWIMRERVHAAFISPDGTPEKSYFETLINDAIAAEEGIRNITGTPFQGNAVWNWGRNTMAPAHGMGSSMGVPPLRQWKRGESAFVQADYGIDTSTTLEAISLFEQDFIMLVLGRGKELGYAFGPLTAWLAPQYVNIVTNPDFNPYISSNGRLPTVRKSDGKYFDSWSSLKTGYNTTWRSTTKFFENLPPGGYAANFLAAASMVADQPGGAAAWNWVQQNIGNDPTFNYDPKWAIVARDAAALPPPVRSACDLDGNGKTDSLDVQMAIDQILGTAACGTADIHKNSRCDVVDLQRIINSALGGACVTTQ